MIHTKMKLLAVVFIVCVFITAAQAAEASELKNVSMEQTEKYLFVADKDSGYFYIFNNNENKNLQNKMYIGNGPAEMIIVNNSLLISLSKAKSIKLLDLNSLEITGSINTPKMPFWMERDGDKLFITVSRDNGTDYKPFIVNLDLADLTKSSSTQSTVWPASSDFSGNDQILINPNDHTLFTGNRGYSPDNISKFDINNPYVPVFLLKNEHGSLGSNCRQFIFNNDYSKIYLACGDGGNTGTGYNLLVVNPANLARDAALLYGAYPNAVAVDENYIYAGKDAYYDNGDVSVFSKLNNAKVAEYNFAEKESLLPRGISSGKQTYAVSGKYLYSLQDFLSAGSASLTPIKIYDFVNNSKPLPDFIISEIGVKYFYEGGNAGDYYYAVVQNIGNAYISNGNDSLGIKFEGSNGWLGASLDLSYYTQKQYAQGDVIESNQKIELVGPSTNQANTGSYTIKAIIDPNNNVVETKEDNNSYTKSVNVSKLDLKIDSILVASNNVNLNVKDVSVYFNRIDAKYFKQYKIKLYDKNSGYTDYKTVLSSAQGNVDFSLKPGTYDLLLTIDSENAIAESNELNNSYEKSVNIIINNAKPDITVKDVYFSPADPLLNQVYNGELHVKVANIGNGATNSRSGAGVMVAVALSSNYVLQIWNSDGLKIIDDMAGNSTVDVVFPVKYAKFTSPALEIRVWLDSNAIISSNHNDNLYIDESDESNNFLEKKITLKTDAGSAGDLLNVKLDKVALNEKEIEANFQISNLTYNNSDPEVNNSRAAKPLEYIQHTIQSNNYAKDGQYFTTGLRSYSSVEDAKKLFDYHNINHTRKIIDLSDTEKFGDSTYCHVVEPGANGINNKNQQGELMYYFICGFRYKNLYIFTQSMLNENNYKRTLNNLTEYYLNLINYDKDRIPFIPGISSEEIKDSQIVKNNQISQDNHATNSADDQINKIISNANRLTNNKLDEILAELKELRNLVKEQQTQIKYLTSLKKDVKNLSQKVESALNNFITYGVDANTQKLGAGERAAVIASYKSAFSKLPETEAELADAIKIANGRWPSLTNQAAENKAKAQFKKIYKKDADMNNAHDNAAITVMAYGLRQKAENRNLNSEKTGIKTFKGIYGKTPSTTEDWNIMQAITYSGASR